MAEVTGQNSEFHQLEDLLRRVLSIAERPAPKPEVPDVEKLLQQLVGETQSQPTKAVNPTVTTTFENMLLSFLDGQPGDSGHLRNSDHPDETGRM